MIILRRKEYETSWIAWVAAFILLTLGLLGGMASLRKGALIKGSLIVLATLPWFIVWAFHFFSTRRKRAQQRRASAVRKRRLRAALQNAEFERRNPHRVVDWCLLLHPVSISRAARALIRRLPNGAVVIVGAEINGRLPAPAPCILGEPLDLRRDAGVLWSAPEDVGQSVRNEIETRGEAVRRQSRRAQRKSHRDQRSRRGHRWRHCARFRCLWRKLSIAAGVGVIMGAALIGLTGIVAGLALTAAIAFWVGRATVRGQYWPLAIATAMIVAVIALRTYVRGRRIHYVVAGGIIRVAGAVFGRRKARLHTPEQTPLVIDLRTSQLFWGRGQLRQARLTIDQLTLATIWLSSQTRPPLSTIHTFLTDAAWENAEQPTQT